MSRKTFIIGVSMDKETLEIIDKLKKRYSITSRSQVIRIAVKEFARRAGLEE